MSREFQIYEGKTPSGETRLIWSIDDKAIDPLDFWVLEPGTTVEEGRRVIESGAMNPEVVA